MNTQAHLVHTRLAPKAERANRPGSPRLCRATDRQVRVLFLIDQLSALGGGERAMMQMVRELSARFQCRVVALRGEVHPDVSKLLPVQVDVIPLTRTYTLGALRSALHLRRIIRESDTEIVHTFFETADLWGGIVAKLCGVRVLISSRRDMGILRSPKHRLAYRCVSHLCRAILTVSDAVREFVIQSDRIDPSRVTTLYNGVAPMPDIPTGELAHLRLTMNIPANSPVVLKVANILPWKGHMDFLECAALVHAEHPDAYFLVAGAPADKDLLSALIKRRAELGLDGCFTFMGDCSSVKPLYQLASVVCLLSHTEGLPNVLLEAMSAQRPVVATRAGGTPEVVVDGETGYLVDVGDACNAARKVSALLGSNSLAHSMGCVAVRRVHEHFGLDRMIESLEGIYDSSLRRK